MDKKVTVVKGTYEFNCKTRFVCHDNSERRSWYTLTSSFCIQKAYAILAVCPSEYCAVYVNGEFANTCPYNRDKITGNLAGNDFSTNATITIGSDSCLIKLYSIKLYNRGLTES
jgi:hypothetical protein